MAVLSGARVLSIDIQIFKYYTRVGSNGHIVSVVVEHVVGVVPEATPVVVNAPVTVLIMGEVIGKNCRFLDFLRVYMSAIGQVVQG